VTKPVGRDCPVPGSPCLRVLDDLRAELARLRAREDARRSVPCLNCGERNRIALGGSPRCYRCKTGHETEGDHVRGSGSGPSVLRVDANVNRIAAEGERLWRSVGRNDLCPPCVYGYGLRVGILLARLEVDL